MIWDHLTTTDFEQIDRSTPVLLPISATEQHGPHLPLATDRIIGEHFCRRLNEAIPDDMLLLPSISIGYSEHHMDFAGTLSINHSTAIQQAEKILASCHRHGFRNFIIFNSHGGNQGWSQVLTEKIGGKFPTANLVLVTWWKLAAQTLLDISTTGAGGVGHAGEFETSLLLHINPNLVDQENIPRKANTKTFDWAEMDMLRSPSAALYRTMKQMTPTGVFGDATQSTAEKGKNISDMVVDQLKQIVVDLKQHR